MQDNESNSQIPVSEHDARDDEFDDNRFLEEEFGTPKEVDPSEESENAAAQARGIDAAEFDTNAIFGEGADNEFGDWPDEELLEGEYETQENPSTLRSDRRSDDSGDAVAQCEAPEAPEDTGEFCAGESAEMLEHEASTETEELMAGSTETGSTGSDQTSEFEEPIAETPANKISRYDRIRTIFNFRFLVVSAACALALFLLASQAYRLKGAGLRLGKFDMLTANEIEATPVVAGDFQNEFGLESAQKESSLPFSSNLHPDVSNGSAMRELSPEIGEYSGKTGSAVGNVPSQGIIQFRTSGNLDQSGPADASELSEWEALLATDNGQANRFQGLWGERKTEVDDIKQNPDKSTQYRKLSDAGNFRRPEAASSEKGIELEFSEYAIQANDPALAGSIGSTNEGEAAAANEFGENGADSSMRSQFLKMESRLSRVEENVENLARGDVGASVLGEEIRSVANDLDAYRAEMNQIMLSMRQYGENDRETSQLRSSVQLLEERVSNLSIDLVAVAELAATGRPNELNSAAYPSARNSDSVSSRSSTDLAYDQNPVRFLRKSFNGAMELGTFSKRAVAPNSTYNISSETREFGIGSEMLSPGDDLASIGEILETIRDENGGLLIVASRGAFYVDPN
ncbi:MAG: hypothetical protein OXI87_05005 [Albidovulum sp.]|nr:hypothetical protein [Albidovulum sp.]